MTDEEMEIDVNEMKCDILRKMLGTMEVIDVLIPVVRNYYDIYRKSAPMGSQSSVAKDIDLKLDDMQTNNNKVENEIKTLLSSLGCGRSTF